MISRKRPFEEDEAVDRVKPAGKARRKLAKTEARVKEFAELNARANTATITPVTIKAQVEQLDPTVPEGPTVLAPVPASASAPSSISKGMSDYENEGPSLLSYPLRNDKGKGLAPRDPPDTAADLYKKDMWRAEWEKETKAKILAEMMNEARSQLEYRLESEKREWEAKAIEIMDQQIEAVKQGFQPQVTMALEAARNAKAHAETQIELCNRIRADLQTKQAEVDYLQAHLNQANTSSTDGFAKNEQGNATALLNQRDLEIQQLVAESTRAKSDLESSKKACHDAVKEAANHAEEIKNLEERLEVVRGVNRDLFLAGVEKDKKIYRLETGLDGAQPISQVSQGLTKEQNESDGESQTLRDPNATKELNHAEEIKNLEEKLEVVRGVKQDLYSAGVEKDKKICQLETALEGFQTLSQACQKLSKEPKESDGESQAPTRDPKTANESNVDKLFLQQTMAKSRRDEYLVRKLRCKLAKLADESAKLKTLKMEMAAGLKEAMEEKEKVVHKLMKLDDEHQILKRRNRDMARKALKDAANIVQLTNLVKLLYSAKQQLLHENRTLELRKNSFKSRLLAKSNFLDDANSQILRLTRDIRTKECQLAKTVRAQNWEIKALKKDVREGENTIFTLRQWDAESGVTERDELIKERDHIIKKRDKRIKQLEKDGKKSMDHIQKLEQEIFEHQNVGLIGRFTSWVFGTPHFKKVTASHGRDQFFTESSTLHI